MEEKIQKESQKKIFFHHDNVRLHVVKSIVQKIKKLGWKIFLI